MRAVWNWFQNYKRPYVSFSWEGILHSVDGRSLCSILEPAHRAYVAIMNILLDAGARSVEPLVVALKELGLGDLMEDGRLGPGLAEVERSILQEIDKGIKVIQLTSGNVEYLLQLLGRIIQHMHDASSIPQAFFALSISHNACVLQMLAYRFRIPSSLVDREFESLFGTT